MKRLLMTIFAAMTALASTLSAQAQPRVVEIAQPTMKVFLPDPSLATGRAVIAFPGGGYTHLAMNNEGYDWAPFFNDQGIAYAVVTYRMPKGDKNIPLADALAAMKVMTDSATHWGISPEDIGVMGSSAGGHLASTLATHAPAELRPAFQILFYPVITMSKGYTHAGSRKNLLGENPPQPDVDMFSNELCVTPSTPRAFIALSDDDRAVPPANSVNYYTALHSVGVPAVLHIYPSGGHGWGFRDKFTFKQQILGELKAWLDSFASPSKQE